jgi:hypothetical protein
VECRCSRTWRSPCPCTLAELPRAAPPAGRRVLPDGEPGEELFLLKEGSIVVSKPITGRVEQARQDRAGRGVRRDERFGDERHRSATPGPRRTRLYSLDRDSLSRFIAGSPQTAARFFQHMAQAAFKRLRDSSDLVAEVTRWGLEATGLDVEHK